MAYFAPVKYLYKLAELIRQDYQLDVIDVWRQRGVMLPEDHSAFVQEQDFRAACKLAVDYVDDPILGLKFGGTVTLMNMASLGAAMMSCATLSESIHLALDFQKGFIPHAFTMQEEGGNLRIFSSSGKTQDAYTRFDFQVFAMSQIQYIKELSGSAPTSVNVHFTFSKPDQNLYRAYQEYLGTKVAFGRDCSAIIVSSDLINKPLPGRDDISKISFIEICQNTQHQLTAQEGLPDRIYKLLDLDENYPSFENLARMLNVSARSLRYQLGKEGTSYRKLLAHHRLVRATSLLQLSDLPIESISERVGYRDLPSFYRGFKKETGVTPKQWRARRS